MCTEYVEAQSQRFLLVVIGPPGSGKTVFTHELERRIPCLIVSKDKTADRYYSSCGIPQNEDDYLKRFRGPIYEQVHREADYFLAYGPVVVDVTERLKREDEDWYDPYSRIAEMHNVPLFCIELYPPEEILWQRLEQRPTPPAFYNIFTEAGRQRFIQDWLAKPSKLPADCGLRIDNSERSLSETVDIALTFMKERFESLLQVRLMLNYI